MDDGHRDFFASVVQQSKQLSKCSKPKAVIIVGGESIYGIGYNRSIATKKHKDYYETSPAFEAIRSYFNRGNLKEIGRKIRGDGIEGDNPSEVVAFFSYFPHVEELTMLYLADIYKLYFFGDIDNEEAVNFLNNTIDSNKKTIFEIIRLS